MNVTFRDRLVQRAQDGCADDGWDRRYRPVIEKAIDSILDLVRPAGKRDEDSRTNESPTHRAPAPALADGKAAGPETRECPACDGTLWFIKGKWVHTFRDQTEKCGYVPDDESSGVTVGSVHCTMHIAFLAGCVYCQATKRSLEAATGGHRFNLPKRPVEVGDYDPDDKPDGTLVDDATDDAATVGPFESGRLACGARHIADGFVTECHLEAMHAGAHRTDLRGGQRIRWDHIDYEGVSSAETDEAVRLGEALWEAVASSPGYRPESELGDAMRAWSAMMIERFDRAVRPADGTTKDQS